MKAINDQELAQLPQGRILGIDFGTKRIGIALSDPFQILASSHSTIRYEGAGKLLASLRPILEENDVKTIVIGMPYNMDGSESDRTRKVKAFVDTLSQHFTMPLIEWDERWSSISAEKAMIESGRSPSRNREKVDQIAAAIILQNFLDRLDRFRKSR